MVEAGPSRQVEILDNVVSGCDQGIYIAGDPPSSEVEIRNNRLFANGDGIRVSGLQDSKLIDNHVYLNHWVGISLFEGSSGNRILGNSASGNGIYDLGHEPGSSPNLWEDNICAVSVGADIDCP